MYVIRGAVRLHRLRDNGLLSEDLVLLYTHTRM